MSLQAWQTMHPPKRGPKWRRPRVHIGFHNSWTKNNLHLRVKDRVKEIIYGGGADVSSVKMYVTGASQPNPHFLKPAYGRNCRSSFTTSFEGVRACAQYNCAEQYASLFLSLCRGEMPTC